MNKNTVVGIDPSTSGHGVAEYQDGKLVHLSKMKRNEIIEKYRFNSDVLFSIEELRTASHLDASKSGFNKKVDMKKMFNIGMCKQAMVELIEDLEHYNMPYITHKRCSTWKGDRGSDARKESEKNQFAMTTGWEGRSNADTRSAAYFGFIQSR